MQQGAAMNGQYIIATLVIDLPRCRPQLKPGVLVNLERVVLSDGSVAFGFRRVSLAEERLKLWPYRET
jgi:hypothetical protein